MESVQDMADRCCMSGFSADVVLLMILVALVTAAVLLLNRTHSRTAQAGRIAIKHEADADLRRLREDLRSAAGRMLRTADRVLSLAGSRSSDDRARSELMEPGEHDHAA